MNFESSKFETLYRHESLVEKLSFMTILYQLGCIIPNICFNLERHSKHSCHIGHFLSFWIVSQKTMFLLVNRVLYKQHKNTYKKLPMTL